MLSEQLSPVSSRRSCTISSTLWHSAHTEPQAQIIDSLWKYSKMWHNTTPHEMRFTFNKTEAASFGPLMRDLKTGSSYDGIFKVAPRCQFCVCFYLVSRASWSSAAPIYLCSRVIYQGCIGDASLWVCGWRTAHTARWKSTLVSMLSAAESNSEILQEHWALRRLIHLFCRFNSKNCIYH